MTYDWKRIEIELNAKRQAQEKILDSYASDREAVSVRTTDYSAVLKHIESALRQTEDPTNG